MNILIRYMGYILVISAFFRLIPIVAGIIYGESILAFLIAFVVSLLLGIMLLWADKHFEFWNGTLSLQRLNLPNALILVSTSFLVLSAIGAISFLPHFGYNFIDAFFESISGFTTTGLTLFSTVEELPLSLLLWRAETQWIGGIGIVLVFLFIITRVRYHGHEEDTQIQSTSSLYEAQGFREQLEPSLQKSSKNILLIYGGYTLLGLVALLFTGMSFFESLSLTFTSLSTGGFIVTDRLQVSVLQLVILSVLMLIGSTSFIVHNKILQKKFKSFVFSKERNMFLLLLSLCIFLGLFVFGDIKVVIFELISAFTTTGYSIAAISVLPPLLIFLIMLGMVIGGSVASTSGGIKVSRVYSLLMLCPWTIKKLSSPQHALIPLKIFGQSAEEKEILIVTVFVTLFALILVIGTILFLLMGYGLLDSSFQMASALGTVGLQTMDLASIPLVGKLVLITAMLLGRLEIFPLLILLRRSWKSLN